jgi:uncharacterized cupin superfamily protein
VRRTNIFTPELDHSSEWAGYRWRGARVGKAVGGEQIGACVYELPEGERTYPFHFHHATEEWLIVVAGTPTLREPEGERVLRAGDAVCFPVGAEGAHQIRGPGAVLIVSANQPLECSEYPDSGKLGVGPVRKLFRVADAVDYWDGEE